MKKWVVNLSQRKLTKNHGFGERSQFTVLPDKIPVGDFIVETETVIRAALTSAKSRGMVVLTYVKGLMEEVTGILKKRGVSMVIKLHHLDEALSLAQG